MRIQLLYFILCCDLNSCKMYCEMSAVLAKLAVHMDSIYFEWKGMHFAYCYWGAACIQCRPRFCQMKIARKSPCMQRPHISGLCKKNDVHICHMHMDGHGIMYDVQLYLHNVHAGKMENIQWTLYVFAWLDSSKDKNTKSHVKFGEKFI